MEVSRVGVEVYPNVRWVDAGNVVNLLPDIVEGFRSIADGNPLIDKLYTVEYVVQQLQEGNFQLFKMYKSGAFDGYAITLIRVYPKCKILEIPFVWGAFGRTNRNDMLKMLQVFGESQGCDYVQGFGRSGWLRGMDVSWERTLSFILEVDNYANS